MAEEDTSDLEEVFELEESSVKVTNFVGVLLSEWSKACGPQILRILIVLLCGICG